MFRLTRSKIAGCIALLAFALAASAAAAAGGSGGDGSVATTLATSASATALSAPSGFAGTGLASNISPMSPLSAAIATNIDPAGGQAPDSAVMGNWDGRDDFVAEHSGTTLDCAASPPVTCAAGARFLRSAISEHTVANGFNENVSYVGDSVGNVHVLYNNSSSSSTAPDGGFTINLPTTLNAFGTLNGGDQIVVTGLAVNPVADLTSFPNVNGAFSAFDGQTGEILYVSFLDTGGGLRLTGNGQLIKSGLLAFPVADLTSPATAPPGIISPTGFPVTVGGSFGVVFTIYSNVGGIAVDDHGNVFFHQADLVNMTGGNIVEIASLDEPSGGTPWQDRSLAVNAFVTITTLNPANGDYGNASGPAKQVNHATNYSGTSTLFGNIAALAAGPNDTLYAAVAPSHPKKVSKKSNVNQDGPFVNAKKLGDTPSMIISFRDYKPGPTASPEPDGFADSVDRKAVQPGLNNFLPFVYGSGAKPKFKLKGAPKAYTVTPFQVDYTVYGGLAVDQANTVYVVSGGTPAGVGLDPSPTLGEVLAFPDTNPFNRVADAIDFGRGNTVPQPGGTGGGTFDGGSDRFDHLYWQAPIDESSLTPVGIAGLNMGFLRYLNRTAPNSITNLPNGATQSDDSTAGPIAFNDFDPVVAVNAANPFCGGQVAGGDRCFPPFTASDDGFEFVFGTPQLSPMTSFYLNSNGNITFGAGDTSNSPSPTSLATGAGRIAAVWTDLDPGSHGAYPNTFPVQALGFAAPHQFVVRNIDVPEFGAQSNGHSNTFSTSLFDNGTGVDGVSPHDHAEGPRAPRQVDPFGTAIMPACSGFFTFQYGRMDLDGASAVTGYSTGGLGSATGATNLSSVGRSALIGNGTQPMIYESFNSSSYDLRSEGANTQAATPSFQTDQSREVLDFFGASCP
jgi:hypothetical protein